MFHKKFLKCLLGVNRGTANCMVYGELGRFCLSSVVEKRMVNFWARLITCNKSKLSCVMYKLLRQLHDKGIFESSWIVKVKGILDKCGMSNIWLDSNIVLNIQWIKSSVGLRLDDIAQQNWCEEVNRNRLCTNYRIFKQVSTFEPYLNKLDFTDRTSLCKFRCGNHRLPVANGRYLPDQLPQYCNMCDIQDPGDEFHYLFKCPVFKKFRKKFIKPYYRQRPNVQKMHMLFSSRNTKELKNLSRFCKTIMSSF